MGLHLRQDLAQALRWLRALGPVLIEPLCERLQGLGMPMPPVSRQAVVIKQIHQNATEAAQPPRQALPALQKHRVAVGVAIDAPVQDHRLAGERRELIRHRPLEEIPQQRPITGIRVGLGQIGMGQIVHGGQFSGSVDSLT